MGFSDMVYPLELHTVPDPANQMLPLEGRLRISDNGSAEPRQNILQEHPKPVANQNPCYRSQGVYLEESFKTWVRNDLKK